jgi:hypothetical protein
MIIYRMGLAILISILVILPACTNVSTDVAEVNKSQVGQSDDTIELRNETEHFQFYCVQSDAECLEDLAEALEENYSNITTDLKVDLDFKVKVHVYKDIDTFHKYTGRTDAPDWVVGTAYGNGIEMVSPLNPGGTHNYDSLIKVVVHEFTHVLINNITSSGIMVPLWLHEGVATYEAKQTDQLYELGKWVKRNKIPSLDTLESYSSYDTMSENKLYPFSYTIVEYIIDEYGIEKLNDFIRSPSEYSDAFGVNKNEFEQAWKEYLKEKYESYR